METYVRLKILSDDLNAKQLSDRIGIDGDRVWNTGDIRPKTQIKEKRNGWLLNSGLHKSESIEEQINALLVRVREVRNIIKELANTNTIEVSCAIYASENPPLYLDKNIIIGMESLGASLDVDLYIFPEG